MITILHFPTAASSASHCRRHPLLQWRLVAISCCPSAAAQCPTTTISSNISSITSYWPRPPAAEMPAPPWTTSTSASSCRLAQPLLPPPLLPCSAAGHTLLPERMGLWHTFSTPKCQCQCHRLWVQQQQQRRKWWLTNASKSISSSNSKCCSNNSSWWWSTSSAGKRCRCWQAGKRKRRGRGKYSPKGSDKKNSSRNSSSSKALANYRFFG